MKIGLSEHFTYKKLIKFTIPTIIMMIFTSVYGIVDGLFISNIVGRDAFAAINLIYPVLMIMGTAGFMIGTGGSALVSKIMGEGESEKAKQYFSMLIYLIIILGIIFTALGIILVKPVSIALGAEGDILNYCVTYGRILLIALTSFLLQNCFQSFFVVAEKPKMGLMMSIISGVINMILDFILIYILKIGIIGAAITTAISQIVGGIVPIIFFLRKNDTPLQLVKAKFDRKAIIVSCINGSSEMLTNVSISLVNILYNMQLMKYIGANGVIAYGIILYVGYILISTYIGYSMGSAPIISYNYGAENKEELKNVFKKSIKLIAVISVIMTILIELSAKILAGIFVSYDKELLEMTTNAIRIFSISYLISGFNIYASSFFTALNNGFVSAVISFLRTLIFQTIMILILPLIWGVNGIWIAVAFAEALSIIVSISFLISNRKKYEY